MVRAKLRDSHRNKWMLWVWRSKDQTLVELLTRHQRATTWSRRFARFRKIPIQPCKEDRVPHQVLPRYLLSKKELLAVVNKLCLLCKKSRKVIIQTEKLNHKRRHLPTAHHQPNVTKTRLTHSVTRLSFKHNKRTKHFLLWPNIRKKSRRKWSSWRLKLKARETPRDLSINTNMGPAD